MKRITTILSLIAMMLVSGITYADDINIFLRNQWDNEMEANDTTRDTQVLFLADRIEGKVPGKCDPDDYIEVDLTKPNCTGEECYIITVTPPVSGGVVYLPDGSKVTDANKTWKVKKGQPGLFQIIPDADLKVVEPVGGNCGGNLYPGYYMTNHETTKDCSVSFTFTSGPPPAQQCDKEPITPQECVDAGGKWESNACTYEGGVKPIVVPTDKQGCIDAGGLYTGSERGNYSEASTSENNSMQIHNIVVAPVFGSLVKEASEGACILPQSPASGGSGIAKTLYFCQPPKFKICTTTATTDSIDYRSSIAAAMNARPDVKYGLYATTATGAQQVFPVQSRTAAEISTLITDVLMNDVPATAKFKAIDGTSIPTMSALSDVYTYLNDDANSPLLSDCAHLQLVMLTSGGHSGDDDKYSKDFDLKTDAVVYRAGIDTTSYASLLKGVAEYFNNKSGTKILPADPDNIKDSCTARVTTNVIGIDPPAGSKLFDTTLAEDMAAAGGGIYKLLELPDNADNDDRDEFGTNLVNTILDVFDHSRDGATALVTPVAGVSITRGYHDNTLYAPAFEAQEGVSWPGNINIGTIDAIPAASLANADTDFSFPPLRKIYTLNDAGTAVVALAAEGVEEDDFNQADVDWLKNLGKATKPDTFSKTEIRELLGDILHFRPLPIHIGDQVGGSNAVDVVDNNELFVVVGTNRGLLHVFDKAGEEQWAFLPPQLKPMIKALRQKNIAPTYNMVNHFYGVDGAPSLFIYDRNKDGKIVKTNDLATTDMIMLYFGLRRGGAGYFAFDITDPTGVPTVKWRIGKATLQYGQPRTGTITSVEGSKDATFNKSEKVDPEVQLVGDGGTAGVCNEMVITQGALITNKTIGVQCGDAVDIDGNKCSSWVGIGSTELCLLGTCDKVADVTAETPYLSTGLGSEHRVLETITGTYLGTQNGVRVWTSKRLCTPTIGLGDQSTDIKPESLMHYTTTRILNSPDVQMCNVQPTNENNVAVKGKLAVGPTAHVILGFNINPLVDLLNNDQITIKSVTLSLGHTPFTGGLADEKNYGNGVEVYAAKAGSYGDHPWQEGGTTTSGKAKDCNAMVNITGDGVSVNGGVSVTKLLAPANDSNRTSGGVITSETVLNEIFNSANWYTTKMSGNDYEVNGKEITLTGDTWEQSNTYIQFGLKHADAVSWGMVRESAALANHLNKVSYPNGDYYEKVMPNLHVEWCWVGTPGCSGGTTPLQRNIKVTKTGTGAATGTITSSPAGIDCGATCDASFNQNSTVTLTAVPNGTTFQGWGGQTGCSGTDLTCDVSLADNVIVSPVFDAAAQEDPQVAVTIAGTGSGRVTGSASVIDCNTGSTENCSNSDLTSGDNLVLTAAVGSGSTFAGWAGEACSGSTDLSCSVENITNMREITATFNTEAPVEYAATASIKSGQEDKGSIAAIEYQDGKAVISITVVGDNQLDEDSFDRNCPIGDLVGTTYTTGTLTGNCNVVVAFVVSSSATCSTSKSATNAEHVSNSRAALTGDNNCSQCDGSWSCCTGYGAKGWNPSASMCTSNMVEDACWSATNSYTASGAGTWSGLPTVPQTLYENELNEVWYTDQNTCINAEATP